MQNTGEAKSFSSIARRICASVIVSALLSGAGSFGNSGIKTRVVYGQGLVSLCDLSLEMEGMWEEGSSSNKAVEIGAAGYTLVKSHLQAGMLVCQRADNSKQLPVGTWCLAFLSVYSKHLFAKLKLEACSLLDSRQPGEKNKKRHKLIKCDLSWNLQQCWRDELPFRNAAVDVKSVLCSG